MRLRIAQQTRSGLDVKNTFVKLYMYLANHMIRFIQLNLASLVYKSSISEHIIIEQAYMYIAMDT